jgi:hypothetical protein
LPVGSFGEGYGGAIVEAAGYTKNSLSIRASIWAIPRRSGGRSNQYSDVPGMIVCEATDIEFSQLRISRAYIKLLCIPEGAAKIVSLAYIGNYEVRMRECSQSDSDTTPLFSIELFDHDAQSRVDATCVGVVSAGASGQAHKVALKGGGQLLIDLLDWIYKTVTDE